MQTSRVITDGEDIVNAMACQAAEQLAELRKAEDLRCELRAFPGVSYEPEPIFRLLTDGLADRPGWTLLFHWEWITYRPPWVHSLWRSPAGIVALWVRGDSVRFYAVGKEPKLLRAELRGLLRELKAFEVKPVDDRIPVVTMTWGGMDVREQTSRLSCPRFGELAHNYPSYTRRALEELTAVLARPVAERNGKLAILHGTPGTGKTWAMRALMQELHERYKLVVIADPEKFFSIPAYCLSVCSPDEDDEDDDEDELIDGKPKPSLFLFEDAAGIATRDQDGDSLSRFLNITEGILGSGRGDVFLLTFNEELDELDPAFTREGRCLGQIEFGPFAPEEAAEWLEREGCDAPRPSTPITLADLYSLKADHDATAEGESTDEAPVLVKSLRSAREPRRVGFALAQKP